MDDDDMLLVAQGDSVAFERILRRHESRLVNWLRGWYFNDAEDVSQEVFIRVFMKASSYTPGDFTAWIYRIARNILTDRSRRNQRRESTMPKASEDFEDFVARYAVEKSDPAKIVEHRDEMESVKAALESAPEEQSDVIYCFAEGWSLPEIADMAGTCLATTKGRLRLGRRKIAERLGREAELAVG